MYSMGSSMQSISLRPDTMSRNLGPITELRKFFLRWIEALFLPLYNGMVLYNSMYRKSANFQWWKTKA